jgi:hypothetical protein
MSVIVCEPSSSLAWASRLAVMTVGRPRWRDRCPAPDRRLLPSLAGPSAPSFTSRCCGACAETSGFLHMTDFVPSGISLASPREPCRGAGTSPPCATIPAPTAHATSSAVVATPARRRACPRYSCTVRRDSPRARALCPAVLPFAASCTTSRCRGVRLWALSPAQSHVTCPSIPLPPKPHLTSAHPGTGQRPGRPISNPRPLPAMVWASRLP